MKRAAEDEYRQFVAARMDSLRRTAYLLCRDWHTADDLVSITLGKLYRNWRRVRDAENVEAYVRGVLTHAWLDELRRPWRRERSVDQLPDHVEPQVAEASAVDRDLLLHLLGQLPPRRKAVVVLRYYCDLSVEQTADILGITTGAVKSQAARALEALRLIVADEIALTAGREKA
ncbi:RNA polymerase sigma-70 factor, sigma-E family [Micromonospora pattaloongensis]|uniref:RNA polymerase sigma-70 factor, sigma-E family n=1 Tax=Micromonospora pattaloongensis TaxID=405436 RepID=A0A1H3G734_9ACTN|nr:SigE family RNA polymerase sigma factor [Micromonospora pattaloongensis]SDX99143.1 RNA polymerase sigma-70 factor, sigma-E family [Micromonospora pattaloongensis]